MLLVLSRTAASLLVASKRVVVARGRLGVALSTGTTQLLQPHYYDSFQKGSRRFRSATTPDNNTNNNSEDEATFSSPYEYPTRTEAPEIVTTLAKTLDFQAATAAAAAATAKVSSPVVKEYALLHGDPFDDQHSLTVEEQAAQRLALERLHNTTTSATTSSPHLLPITPEIPVFVPPNVPSDQLEAPETLITRLDNGVRVVSQVRTNYNRSTILLSIMLCVLCG